MEHDRRMQITYLSRGVLGYFLGIIPVAISATLIRDVSRNVRGALKYGRLTGT